MPRERSIHRACTGVLRRHGAYHVTQTSPPADAGTADRLVCLPPYGAFVAVELKQPGEQPTDIQRRRMAEVLRAGGWVVVARSADGLDRCLGMIVRQLEATGPLVAPSARILDDAHDFDLPGA